MNTARKEWLPLLAGTIAALYFAMALNFGYLLFTFLELLNIRNNYGEGVILVILAFVVTLLAYATALLYSAHVYKIKSIREVSRKTAIQTSLVFGFLLILFTLYLLSGSSDTTTTDVLTLLQLVVGIIAGFLSVSILSWGTNHYGRTLTPRGKISIVNVLALVSGVLFTYVTLALSSESSSLSSNIFAYGLWFVALCIIPAVIITIIISQIRTSSAWAMTGAIIPMLPLCVFYILGIIFSVIQ